MLPSAAILYGVMQYKIKPINKLDVSTRNEIREDNPTFRTKIDNYLQWMPAASVFALDAAGVKMEHTPLQHAALALMAGAIMSGTTFAVKNSTARIRPDSTEHNSFPSGHTANAFLGAEILHQELKNTHPLLSYSGYVVASATGVLRMYNNRHWFSDVIAGAGVGILSAKVSYWIFNGIQNTRARHKASLYQL